jgi:hypothetical protein
MAMNISHPFKPPLKALPANIPAEDEVNILAQQNKTVPAPAQSLPFISLPAEIRIRIYEYTLPSSEDQLIVATPCRDDLMSLGTQPPITRLSKQVRSETLEMFYTNSTFVAYIEEFDFKALIRWAASISSGTTPPKVTVQVKLLDRIHCVYDSLDLVRAWRDINHHTMHLRIHNCYTNQRQIIFRNPNFDQRALVAKAIEIAEELRQRGSVAESELLGECHKQFEQIDRNNLDSRTILCNSCAFVSPGYFHHNGTGYQAGHIPQFLDEMFD